MEKLEMSNKVKSTIKVHGLWLQHWTDKLLETSDPKYWEVLKGEFAELKKLIKTIQNDTKSQTN